MSDHERCACHIQPGSALQKLAVPCCTAATFIWAGVSGGREGGATLEGDYIAAFVRLQHRHESIDANGDKIVAQRHRAEQCGW